jgi:uncharacterized glyoxalase superfamily protein PhnB
MDTATETGATKMPPVKNGLLPYVTVDGALKAAEFYKRAFGAEEIGRMLGPDGKIAHAEIRIGDSKIMLGEESEEWGAVSPLTTKAVTGSLHLYVPDADASWERALAAGATVKMPLNDAFWGDRYGKVTDPYGHEWGIATRIKDMTPDEMEEAGKVWMAQMAEAGPANG